jgi:hypothetical protein
LVECYLLSVVVSSKLFVDKKLAVDNDGRRGGVGNKCSAVDLTDGQHPLRVEFFRGDGQASVKATYRLLMFSSSKVFVLDLFVTGVFHCSGPDTWNILEPLRSISFEQPADTAPSKWTMRIYSSKEALQDMPKLSWLEFVGQEIVPSIDFRNADDFKQVHNFIYLFVLPLK